MCTKRRWSIHGTSVVLSTICTSSQIDTIMQTKCSLCKSWKQEDYSSNSPKIAIFTIFGLYKNNLFLLHGIPNIVGITAVHFLVQVTMPCTNVLSRSLPDLIFYTVQIELTHFHTFNMILYRPSPFRISNITFFKAWEKLPLSPPPLLNWSNLSWILNSNFQVGIYGYLDVCGLFQRDMCVITKESRRVSIITESQNIRD